MIRSLLRFQLVFWLASAVLLFLYGLSYGHWQVALIRNLYFPVVGFLLSGSLVVVYRSNAFRRLDQPLLAILPVSAAAAFLTAAIINPVTFSLLNIPVAEVAVEIISTDTLYFFLFYVVWSLLYLRRERYLNELAADASGETLTEDHLTVEVRGEIRMLSLPELLVVRSSGDYVELVTAKGTYLKKQTLSNLAAALPAADFTKIHRSTIVNRHAIEWVKPQGRGIYSIKISDGPTVRSSRSCRDSVLQLLPRA